MGAVYRARQVSLNRLVAIKVLLAGHFASRSFLQRFRREAEAAASLNHPHIVSIYEVGEHQGQPYFAMELIEGHSLAELARDQPVPARRAAQWVKRIAEAVHFAHERGLLHRDLKPSNIVVDSSDLPHITDFGLAKREADSDLTLTGQVLGTPNYMPPEQADPKRGPASAASDVYSLGAILYQLLTGRPPFMAETLTQTLHLVVEGDFVMPRLLNPALSRDLETICAKCLEKDPSGRYASAEELAAELGRFLGDEPIRARPIGPPARLMRWCRRKPALAFATSAAAISLSLVVIGSLFAVVRVNHARKLAEAAEQRTEQQLHTALLEQARATVLTDELGHRIRALDAVRRAAAISNSATLRGVAIAALALPDLRLEREWPLTPDTSVANVDPAFQRLAVSRAGGPVEIRSLSNQQVLVTLPASTNLLAVARWSPDGRFLAVARETDSPHREKDVEIWRVADAKRLLLLHGSPGGARSFHPHLPRVLIGLMPSTALIWDLETGQEICRHQLPGRPDAVEFSPDGERFAAVVESGTNWVVGVHDARNGAPGPKHVLATRSREIDWEPSGRGIAVPDFSGAVHWMDARTGETRLLGRHKAAAVFTVFTPNGKYLFSGGWDRELICWDMKSMRRAFVAGLESYNVQFHPNGRQCAVVVWPEMRLQFHSFEQPRLTREFAEDLGGGRNYAAFSPDGRWLAARGDQRLVVWDLAGDGAGAVVDEAGGVRLSFAPSGELFASREESLPERTSECFRWRVLAGTNGGAPILQRLPMSKPPDFVSLSLVSTGAMLTTMKGSKVVGYDQLVGGDGTWHATKNGLNEVSPNERWLGIFRSFTPHLYIYGLPGFEPVAKLTNEARISLFQFSPDGDEIAVSSRAGVEFWSTTNWQRVRHLTNFTGVLYSSDRTFWLYTRFRSASLHDARTLEPILPLPVGTTPLALSQDGRLLATSVDARRVQVWDLVEVRAQLEAVGLDWSERPAAARSNLRR